MKDKITNIETWPKRSKSIPWASACIAADLRSETPLFLLAERSGNGLSFRKIDLSDVAEKKEIPVITFIKSEESLVQRISTPFSSKTKAKRALPTLLDVAMPFPLEDCSVEFLDINKGKDGKVNSLAVAARNESICSIIDKCKANGFDPIVVDSEPLMIWTQSLQEIPPADEWTPNAVMIAEPSHYCIAIGRGEKLIGVHTIKTLSANELARILNSRLGNESEPLHFRICGSLADSQDILRTIYSLDSNRIRKIDVHKSPSDFILRALATRSIISGPLRINLRKGHLTHPDFKKRIIRNANFASIIILSLASLLLSTDFYVLLRMRNVLNSYQAEFEKNRDYILGYRLPIKGDRAVNVVAAEAKSQQEKLMPFTRMFSPSLVALTGEIIEIAKKDSILIDSLSVSEKGLLLSVSTAKKEALITLSDYLRTSGFDITVKQTGASQDGRIFFDISAGGVIVEN